jgi:hypothetical protein
MSTLDEAERRLQAAVRAECAATADEATGREYLAAIEAYKVAFRVQQRAELEEKFRRIEAENRHVYCPRCAKLVQGDAVKCLVCGACVRCD